MPLGIYISVPFCRTKCSFCNFASDVFSRERMQGYVDQVCGHIGASEKLASGQHGVLEKSADTIYLGGGTPSILASEQLKQLFRTVRENFSVAVPAEVTVECAPGTVTPELIDTLLACGVNRVSLGAQSFVDEESRSVGRLHNRRIILDDLARLRAAGLSNINVDLIAGLPHQTMQSWERSLDEAIATGVPHLSVYLLEVDNDSRLGRELLAGGQRYHAHHVPAADLQAEMYELACERLESAGVAQYEISNFAREGFQSAHNLKYWKRRPYLGFGVDAHSMLLAEPDMKKKGMESVRSFTPSTLEDFAGWDGVPSSEPISELGAMEESFFIGLRLNEGIDLRALTRSTVKEDMEIHHGDMLDLLEAGLLELRLGQLRLTKRGRLLSNEVFQKFVGSKTVKDLREMLGIDPDDRLPSGIPSDKIQ